MMNSNNKQCDNENGGESKHLEDYCGQVSSAEENPKSSDEQEDKNVTIAAILSQPVYDVFVQHDKSFRRTDRKQYEKMLEARTNDLMSTIQSESIQAAQTIQIAFHNISLFVQGFLSGLGISHAIFGFAFADIDILNKNYSWLAMPTQATFYACYVISTIASLDRIEIGSSLMDRFRKGLSLQSGDLNLLLCLIGTTATLVSTLYDDWLAVPIKQQEKIPDIVIIDPLIAWRILSGIRATTGLLIWFLVALSPNCNNLLKQLRNPTCELFLLFFSSKIEVTDRYKCILAQFRIF